MAGYAVGGWMNRRPPEDKKKMNTYPASILQAGQDYDDLMSRYRDFLGLSKNSGNMLRSQYEGLLKEKEDPRLTRALNDFGVLSRTGGYSEGDKADIRERGISPIRAVYSNAMQNVTRQKAIQGGYSPNYAASMAKMSRELSQNLSDATTNVNAGIAQNVAQNKLSATPQYAGLLQQQQQGKFNSLNALQALYGMQGNQQLAALGGMRDVYGTTPANPALYGQQAIQRAELDQREPPRYNPYAYRPGKFRLG